MEGRQLLDFLYGQLIQLLQIERAIAVALTEENQMDDATTALIARLNAATNAIAAKIQALIDKSAAAGSASAAEIDTALTPIVAQLEAMGADPASGEI